MAKQVIHGEDSRAAILRGINQLADAVKITLASRSTSTSMRGAAYTVNIAPPGEKIRRPASCHAWQDSRTV